MTPVVTRVDDQLTVTTIHAERGCAPLIETTDYRGRRRTYAVYAWVTMGEVVYLKVDRIHRTKGYAYGCTALLPWDLRQVTTEGAL